MITQIGSGLNLPIDNLQYLTSKIINHCQELTKTNLISWISNCSRFAAQHKDPVSVTGSFKVYVGVLITNIPTSLANPEGLEPPTY